MNGKTRTQVEKTHYGIQYDSPGRFISYYHQIRSVMEKQPKNILEIGIGNKTVSNYLKERGMSVTTCDFDATLEPDVVADIRSLPFRDEMFDLVTAFEVLEHLPFKDFKTSLLEMKRVTRERIIVSIPYVTLNIFGKIKLLPLIKPIYFLWRIVEYRLSEHKFDNQHYWEMGKKGYSRNIIRKEIKSVGLEIEKESTPQLNPYHYFFVLKKPSQAARYSAPN